MKNKLKILALIFSVLMVSSVFFGCTQKKEEGIEIREAQPEMLAGSTQSLNVYDKKTDEKLSEFLIFASSNPAILTVDENGMICAVSPGSATVYVQHSENHTRTELTVNVRYPIISIPRYHVKTVNTPVSGNQYPFWNQKGYQSRVSDWAILDIANILITKGADEYVFSDVYDYKNMTAEEVILISDWSNTDVILDKSMLDGDLLSFISEKYQLGKIASDSLSRATADLKTEIARQIDSYQGKIYLSKLPANMEYRIYVSYDYDVIKVNHFYSRGILNGIWQLGADLWNGNISSLLNSYTYCQTEYEIVNAKNAKIIIEARYK